MLHSIKAKFTLAFGTLMVLLFVALGVFLISEKGRELSVDISTSTQSFARFTVEDFVEAYSQFLEPGNFLPFNREVQGILRENSAVSDVALVSYTGEIVYDSSEEMQQQYDGATRRLPDQTSLDRVQSKNLSLQLGTGEIVYVQVGEDKSVSYVNFNEELVYAPDERDKILNIAMPYADSFTVFYGVSYAELDSRLANARIQIGFVALLGVILTVMVSFVLSSSITRPIKSLKAGALQIAGGDFNTRVEVKTKDEIGLLAQTFNKMAEDLAASTEAMLYQERVKKELDLAKNIQQELLPKDKIVLPKMDLAGGLVPASEIGGDAFDYIPMRDGRYLAYLGDVTGHGVAAGIISSVANAVLYGLRGQENLLDIARLLNEVLREKTNDQLFMTMAMAIWNETDETLSYVNAGHPPIFIYNSEKNSTESLHLQGMALGLADDLEGVLKEHKIQMNKNDVVVMYSDGIPEAVDKKGMQYGTERLKAIVQDVAADLYTAEGIKNAILSDVLDHISGHEQKDDMTLLVFKRKDI
ncbi:SpoIIE family protein phosphatase [Candidatus Peregrinibacteria bacterium]|jgi:serine phosphatase RsbU (regulator of sigma subunit)|nr:SpoIIE family protein phosphatase [Candidatus Peregrinibacteria bacterium]MBT4631589.1 SpoIIE family protein phosphatase [Candidatus Peregrinibacteria bacterium]MBT5517139.1 SpoIIE family protein phosphatase [Candidatus Peregrinibacteria bacterium]MBT5824114.1 SpoIIE family protein phosphatase [Candidatus Peregrinibacteria bacterium]